MSVPQQQAEERDRRTAGAHFSCVMSALMLRKVAELGGGVAVAELLARSGTTRTRDYLTNVGNWISYDEASALWTAAVEVTHHPSLARVVGAEAGARLGGSQVASLLRSLGSPEEVYRQLESTSSKYSTVVRIEVLEIGPGFAEMEVRVVPGFPRTEHLCDWTIGLLTQPPVLFGLPAADIRHDACVGAGGAAMPLLGDLGARGPDQSRRPSPDVIDRLKGELDSMRDRLRAMFDTTADLVGPGSLEEALARIADRAAIEFRAPRHLLVVRMAPDEEILCHAKGFTDEEIRYYCDAADVRRSARSARLVADGPRPIRDA